MQTSRSARVAVVVLCVWCLLCCGRVAAGKGGDLDTCMRLYGGSSDSVPDVLYYRTTPPNGSEGMQYAWSTVGAPTLFFSHGPVPPYCNSSVLSINSEEYREDQAYHSVNISGTDGAFAMAVVLNRLIEFNVTKRFKSADGFDPAKAFNDSSGYSSYYLNDTSLWSFSNKSLVFQLEDNSNQSNFTDKPFKFSIRATFPTRAAKQRLRYFPKTLYTENSTTFDLIVENYPYTMTPSRVALEMLLVHNQNTPSGNVSMDSTVDDEYTPSVFDTFQYLFGKDPASNGTPGFFQWKPISYQSGGRKSTKSQQANVAYASNETQEEHASIARGLASALFEPSTVSNVTLLYIVFGTSGDDTYNQSEYMTWTAVTGYGEVPHDSLSMLVIITIILGLGIPVIVILVGGGYVVYRRKPWKNVVRWVTNVRGRRGYTTLN